MLTALWLHTPVRVTTQVAVCWYLVRIQCCLQPSTASQPFAASESSAASKSFTAIKAGALFAGLCFVNCLLELGG